MKIGSLETGGTKMICAVGNENGEIIDQFQTPTGIPEDTIPILIEWFKNHHIDALGIACFGPLDLHKDSPTYGSITTTPKPGWKNYNIVKAFENDLHIPIGFDTDVNGSLLGELTYGSAKGLTDAVYITIGTGIGGGVLSNGQLLHGMLHPELGHIYMQKHPLDHYEGKCPYHKSCFEGLASGPAIEERWGRKAEELSDQPLVWKIESWYIAQAIMTYIMVLSPQKFILGGGVMHQEQLFPLIRDSLQEQMNHYIQTPEMEDLEQYIVPSSLHDNQGILGGFKLAIDAYQKMK